MGENSNIAWTTHTFNPWVGCQRVSPGCTHCYAESYDRRVGGAVDPADGAKKLRWGPTAPRVRTATANWRKPLKWNAAAKAAGVRHRVFCSSLADVFEDRPELAPWREDLFGLIASTRSLDWLLLTKRPENTRRLWPATMNEPGGHGVLWCPPPDPTWWPNVWLGTTVEDQQRANERVPALLSVPARVRFLSCEPLLERVDLNPWLLSEHGRRAIGAHPGIGWVIIGGESGPGARPFALEWARHLVRQCRSAGGAPFVKQLGARPTAAGSEHIGPDSQCLRHLVDPAGGDPAEWPADLRVREFPEVLRGAVGEATP